MQYYGDESCFGNEWTNEENKVFESALAKLDISSPFLFQNINSILPWKTVDQIRRHYHNLIQDVMDILKDETTTTTTFDMCPPKSPPHPPSLPISASRVHNNQERKGTVPWTEDEHKMFLIGLSKCGKGEWKSISKYYVKSKTAAQVASHAQKYFRRLKCQTPLDKRRYSIHDIRILDNSTIVQAPARHPAQHALIAPISSNNNF